MMRKVMKERITIFSFTIACLFAVPVVQATEIGAKCSANAQPQAEWTVMVFMDGDNNLEKFALKDFEEMARVADSAQVNIVVQLDRIAGFSALYGDWTHTLRFKLRQGMTPIPANALSPSDSELEMGREMNMGHPDTLASFVEWARRKYPARRYMLVMWDHGDGWRLLHSVSPTNDSLAARAVRRHDALAAEAVTSARGTQKRSVGPLVSSDKTLDAPHRAISMDDTDRDRLYVREVQDSLESVLDKKLDLIGFDACLMSMVENGFAMRRVADVMVGSEELEPGDGWKYDHWLPKLVGNPPIEATDLGRILVDSYKETYVTDPETTLSAVDLSQGRAQAFAQAVSALADELTISLDTELASIKGARESCTPYAPGWGYHGIDLHRFCEQLILRTTRQDLRDRAQSVRLMLEDTSFVLSYYAGSYREGMFGSRGLAIYFPQTKAAYLSDSYREAYRDENTTYPVEFVQQHRWDNFLHAYFNRVP
jgi:hypothetical protein